MRDNYKSKKGIIPKTVELRLKCKCKVMRMKNMPRMRLRTNTGKIQRHYMHIKISVLIRIIKGSRGVVSLKGIVSIVINIIEINTNRHNQITG